MAGIYIHIPFCKTRCLYCDFFSSTSMEEKSLYIETLLREMALQKSYLQGEEIHTVYFGGGTPSQLNADDFRKIFEGIQHYFQPEKNIALGIFKEVTLEANPDDISPAYLESLKDLPFNRISLGIQSFNDTDLQFLNRRHDAKQAIQAVKNCQEAGFNNISIDLIYGLPGQTLEDWNTNIKKALSLNVQHISAYHLIYEEGTRLFDLLQNCKIHPIDEDVSVKMFAGMIEQLTTAGFIHYEVSNFGQPDYFSIHNSSYWNGTHYLGLGASAHSFNGTSRQWNISSIKKYCDSISKGILPAEKEIINEISAYNDYIITGLRTMWGINLQEILSHFGEKEQKYCIKQAGKHLANGMLIQEGNQLKLSNDGIFISDGIMSDLLIVP